MDPHLSDEATVCLKEKDIQKLRESEGGVEFEVDEYQNGEEEEDEAFPPEDILNNVYIPDDEDSDEDDELTPFQKLAKKMEDISDDGGVKKRVLHPGGGSVVPEEAIVRVHYNAFLEYADEPYDSTRLRNTPERYKLGQNQLLLGLEIGIRTMKKGELAQLLVSPDYAYGKLGIEPRIPGNSTVMFKLELLNFVEHAGIEDYDMMTKEERDKIEFSDILKFVEVERQLGLQVYKEHAYHKAFGHYKKAAMMLESRNVKDEEEEKTHRGKLFTLYSNMAVCASKQNKFNLVMTYCNKGREIEPNNVKLLFLQGKRHQKFSLVEKDMYQKMFSKPTGQSAEEKEQENLKAKKKLEKNLNVSDDFQKMIEEKLLEFIKDDLQEDMPFPALNLSVGEIACIMEKCENLGLDCKQIGSFDRQQITWPHLVTLVEGDLHGQNGQPGGLRMLPKLTNEHLRLTPSLRMKVKLATQVLSSSVARAFELVDRLRPITRSTRKFIVYMDTFFDCLNVSRLNLDNRKRKCTLGPYQNIADWRLEGQHYRLKIIKMKKEETA